MNWQPIETAPKDGSIVVAGAYMDEYAGEYEPIQTGRLIWEVELARFDGRWLSTDLDEALICPTHWMPLPQPPKGE